MEKQINSFEELTKAGQLLLVDSPFGEDLAVYTGKHKTLKYPITSNGRKCRSLGHVSGKGFQYVYADEVGDTGEEGIWQYDLMTNSPLEWNFRLIDETHPQYDAEFAKYGNHFGSMISMMGKMMGETENIEGVNDNDIADFGKMLMGELGVDPTQMMKPKNKKRKK